MQIGEVTRAIARKLKPAASTVESRAAQGLARDSLKLSAAKTFQPRMIKGLPDAMQMNSYSCGVGSVQAILAYFDPDRLWTYQKPLAKALGTTSRDGTSPEHIVAYLRSQGLKAEVRENLTIKDLEHYVDRKTPVILDYEAYGRKGVDYSKDWADGHYSVVRGYDRDRIYLMDPSQMPGTNAYVTKAELGDRWHDRDFKDGKMHDYVGMGIVVHGRRKPPASAVHTD